MAESKPNNIGIYKITSPSKKIYIGQSRDIRVRWMGYKSSNKNAKYQTRLYRSFVKHGIESHKFDVICHCEESELNKLEAYYIELYQSFDTKHGLNLTSGGGGCKISEETRKRMSLARIGKPAANKGVKASKESIKMRIITMKMNAANGKKRKSKKGVNAGGLNAGAKKVINIENGMTFETIRAAAIYYNIKASNLSNKLNGYGRSKNSTPFRFLSSQLIKNEQA